MTAQSARFRPVKERADIYATHQEQQQNHQHIKLHTNLREQKQHLTKPQEPALSDRDEADKSPTSQDVIYF